MAENNSSLNNNSTQREQFNFIIPACTIVLGDLETKILKVCLEPHTMRETAEVLDRHYQTIRDKVADLIPLGVLVKTTYKSKKGHVHVTNVPALNRYLASHTLGQSIIDGSQGLEKYVNKHKPVEEIYSSEFPEPAESLAMKVGSVSTTLWKYIVGNSNTSAASKNYVNVVGTCILHLWYRNYLMTVEGWRYHQLPGPNTEQIRAIINKLRQDLMDQSNAIRSLLDNHILWADDSEIETWRIMGDFPIRHAKTASDGLVNAWDEGHLTINGLPRNINHDYVNQKAVLDRMYNQEYLEFRRKQEMDGTYVPNVIKDIPMEDE